MCFIDQVSSDAVRGGATSLHRANPMRSDMSGSIKERDRGARSATKDLCSFDFYARLRVYGRILRGWQAADVRLRTFNCERVQHFAALH